MPSPKAPWSLRTYVVQCGNHFLQTDDHRTKVEWTHLARASRHTKEWAEKFVLDYRREANTIAHVIPLADAQESEYNQGLEQVKTHWTYAFEARVREIAGDKFNSGAFWTLAHMYYGYNITVDEAVKRITGKEGPAWARKRAKAS